MSWWIQLTFRGQPFYASRVYAGEFDPTDPTSRAFYARQCAWLRYLLGLWFPFALSALPHALTRCEVIQITGDGRRIWWSDE